jgi:anti-sigma B factor antagonist
MGDELWSDPVGNPGFGVQVCSDAQRSRVSLRGELDLVSAPHLRQVLDQLCRDGYLEIVLDLSGLKFLGAAGLTVFYEVDDQLRAVNGRLILRRPPRLAGRILAATGLDTILTIQPATTRNLTCNHQRGRRAVLTTATARSEPAVHPGTWHHTDA